jgi:hypothetical protein
VGAQIGYHVGDDDFSDLYCLQEFVRSGGEGEVWRATTIRQDGMSEQSWAVKILHGHLLLKSDDESDSVGSARRRWHARLTGSMMETSQLQEAVPGVVGLAKVFIGGEPHPLGEDLTGRSLYAVSTWIEGQDLVRWRGAESPTFDGVCDVLDRLAVVLDAVAAHPKPVVHRDISPANVMVRPDGEVRVIDFTFVRPPNSGAGTVTVDNNGFAAPETRAGDPGLPADRYSFGAVAHYLLTASYLPPQDAAAECRAVLVREGLGMTVGNHVARLLDPDPAARPESLVAWTATLRRLVTAAGSPGRHRELALTVDGRSTPAVVAAGTEAVSHARLGVGMPWRLMADPGSPSVVSALASVVDGSGTQVTFAVNGDGKLVVGRGGLWTSAGSVLPGTGIAALRDPRGMATAFAVDPVERQLTKFAVSLDGESKPTPLGRPVRRVIDVAADRDGAAAVLALSLSGDLTCVKTGDISRVDSGGALDAALCLDQWGELCCYRIGTDNAEVACLSRSTGAWSRAGVTLAPIVPTAIACAGHRQGVAVAVAGERGLFVTTHADSGFGPWRQVTDRPCSRLAFATGAAWRLRLAALVEGRVALTDEDFNGGWLGLTAL